MKPNTNDTSATAKNAKASDKLNQFLFLSEKLRRAYAIYSDCLETLANGFSEEAVHDLRVSIRRFLAVVMLAERMAESQYTAEIRSLLRRQIKLFSPLRDVQVQQIAVQKMLLRFPELSEYAVFLQKRECKLMAKLRAELTGIAEGNVFGLVFFLSRDCYQSLRDKELTREMMENMIEKEFEPVRRAISESDTRDMDTLHSVRLAFKNFRYISEQFTAQLGIGRQELKRMNAFQTALGLIQDNRVLYDSIRNFSAKVSAPNRLKFRLALSEILRQRDELLKKYCLAAANASSFVSDCTSGRNPQPADEE